MKKLLFIAVSIMAIVACKQEAPKKDLAADMQRDSLNKVIVQRDNEINDMLATFNEIEEGFREINEAERRVSLAKQGEGVSRTQRIRENIQFIQSTMRQNRELISKLRQRFAKALLTANSSSEPSRT